MIRIFLILFLALLISCGGEKRNTGADKAYALLEEVWKYKSLSIDVHNGFKYLILKVFLHFGHVAHAFFGETLELCYVDITTIHCQSGVFWQMHLF